MGNLESAGSPQCYPANAKNPGETGVLRTSDHSRGLVEVGDEGLEEVACSAEKPLSMLGKVTPQVTSNAIKSELRVINAKWQSLAAETRQAILHLIESAAE